MYGFWKTVLLKNLIQKYLIKKSAERDIYISLEYPGFTVPCPTRWTVKAESMKSILHKWVALQQVCDESLDENLEPEII